MHEIQLEVTCGWIEVNSKYLNVNCMQIHAVSVFPRRSYC